MKILIIVHQFLPHYKYGVELATYELAQSLRKVGFDVYVISGSKRFSYKEVTVDLEQFHYLPVYRIHFNPKRKNSFFYHRKINEQVGTIIDKVKPDVIHIQHLSTLSLSIINVAKKKNIPVIMSLHDYSLICAQKFFIKGNGIPCFKTDYLSECVSCIEKNLPLQMDSLTKLSAIFFIIRIIWDKLYFYKLIFYNFLKKITNRKPVLTLKTRKDFIKRNKFVEKTLSHIDYLVVYNAYFKNKFSTFTHLPEETFKIINQSVDIPGKNYKVRKFNKKPIKFGFVGSFVFYKGFHLAINAFTRINQADGCIHLWGKPSIKNVKMTAYFQSLKRISETYQNIILHSHGFSRNELEKVFKSFDVLIFPSICFECHPRVVSEAFAFGVPVICSNIGGPAEQVTDGVDGLHFEVGNVDDLVDKIKYLIENPDEIERMSRNIKPPKSMDKYVDEHIKLYKKVIDNY